MSSEEGQLVQSSVAFWSRDLPGRDFFYGADFSPGFHK